MLQDRLIEQDHVDVVVKFFRPGHGERITCKIFLSVGQRMSDPCFRLVRMTKNIRLNSRITASSSIGPPAMRVPRGLAMLRALRLRLAAEKYPRFQQEEFQFTK